jgi:hypothetical protein
VRYEFLALLLSAIALRLIIDAGRSLMARS